MHDSIGTRSLLSCIAIIVCSLWITTAFSQEVRLPVEGGPQANVDRPGSDFQNFTMQKPPSGAIDMRQWECEKACAGNSKCQAWTYVKPNTIQGPQGRCWLKDSIPAAKNNKCCVSGTVGDSNIDRPGSDYTHFNSLKGLDVTARICQQACITQANCKAWTFVKPKTIQGSKGVCWLKNKVPAPVANNCCISGSVQTQVVK